MRLLRSALPLAVAALAMAQSGDSIALMNRIGLTLASAFALSGCNSSVEDADPGPVTQEEAEALEDAASMLEEQRLPEETSEPEVEPTAGEGE